MNKSKTCSKCGSVIKLPEGKSSGFCRNCGTPVQAPAGLTIPSNRFFKPLIIGVSVVAALAVIAVVMVSSLLGSSYQRAEVKFLQSLASSVTGKNGYNIDFSAEYESTGFMNYLIEDMELFGNIDFFGGQFYANTTFSSDDIEINAESVYDGKRIIFASPNTTDRYISMGIESDSRITLNTKALNKTSANIAKKYFEIVNDIAEVEKRTELYGGDMKMKCDKYTINFTEGALAELCLFAIDEILDNRNLLNYVDEYEFAFGGGDVESMLEDARDAFEDYDGDEDKRIVRMTVWVNANKIVARTFDKFSGEDDLKFSYKFMKNSKAVHIQASALGTYNSGFSFVGDFEKEAGAWRGKPKATLKDSYTSYTVNIDCKGLKMSGSQLLGEIKPKVNTGSDYIEATIKFGKSDNKQTIYIEGGNDDIDLGNLSISYSADKVRGIVIPDYDPDYEVSINDIIDGNYSQTAVNMIVNEFLGLYMYGFDEIEY